MLHSSDATEVYGDVYGFNLVYSGNHYAAVEVSAFGKTRIVSGIQPLGFRWRLAPGERFDTPEAVYTRLPVDPDGVDPELLSSWEEYQLEKQSANAKPKQNTQLSLMWPADDPLQCIVVTGFSDSGTFLGWELRTAELMDVAKLDQARLTREEIDAIHKVVPARNLVFPSKQDPARNPYDTPGYEKSPGGGSIGF